MVETTKRIDVTVTPKEHAVVAAFFAGVLPQALGKKEFTAVELAQKTPLILRNQNVPRAEEFMAEVAREKHGWQGALTTIQLTANTVVGKPDAILTPKQGGETIARFLETTALGRQIVKGMAQVIPKLPKQE